MLNGPYQILRPAYHAVGRIGYAQEGIPTSDDYSFGTGFLITPNHVMTNRHVHGFYGHYLTSDDDCGGIEFIAEKDKDSSDFIAFNGEPPLLLEGLDIAIYTLSRPAENRTPIARLPIPTHDLDGREIAVIGYPDTHEPNNPEILAAFEENPVFAVKRISQGHIFRHSTDIGNPYGVEARVDKDETASFPDHNPKALLSPIKAISKIGMNTKISGRAQHLFFYLLLLTLIATVNSPVTA